MGFSLSKITKSIGNVFKKVEQTIRPVVKAAIVPAATLLTAPIGGIGGIVAQGAQGAYEYQDAVSDANKAYDAAVAQANAPAPGMLPTDAVVSVRSGLTPSGQGSGAGGLYGPSAVNQAGGTSTAPLFAGMDAKTLLIIGAMLFGLLMMRR